MSKNTIQKLLQINSLINDTQIRTQLAIFRQ